MKIKVASHHDIDKMIEICQENLVANRGAEAVENLGKSGFLIRSLTRDDAKEMLDDTTNHVALAAFNENEIVGYLTGCDIKKTEAEFQQKISAIASLQKFDKIFYYKQIAKKPGTQGVGKVLFSAMVDEVKYRGYSCIVCKIVHSPLRNEASIAFHRKVGFEEVGSIAQNGFQLGIYWCAL